MSMFYVENFLCAFCKYFCRTPVKPIPRQLIQEANSSQVNPSQKPTHSFQTNQCPYACWLGMNWLLGWAALGLVGLRWCSWEPFFVIERWFWVVQTNRQRCFLWEMMAYGNNNKIMITVALNGKIRLKGFCEEYKDYARWCRVDCPTWSFILQSARIINTFMVVL